MHPRAFTLIELLVVIAIIAILSVVVILTLNPASLLQQSRDANRVSDLANLNESLSIYLEDQGGSLGNASTTYLSLADPVATSTLGDQCQGLNLPTLPSSTTYHCAASSTLRNPNGSGWMPINFSSISFGAPLALLPVDPVNTSSSGDYYAYLPGQSSLNTYELIARMESAKYTNAQGSAANDGGYSSQYEEVGKDLTLALSMPQDLNRVSSSDYLSFDQQGLVGYWPMNEGGGTTVYDKSGNGNNGVNTGATYTAGKVGTYALQFYGGTNNGGSASYITLSSSTIFDPSVFTISAWINTSNINSQYNYIYSNARDCCGTYNGINFAANGGNVGLAIWYGSGSPASVWTSGGISSSTWTFVTGTYDGTTIKVYINGVLSASGAYSGGVGSPASYGTVLGALANGPPLYDWTGSLNDLRLYNRALSASEIQAMYNGGI
jgi:prepilin-type N-terminal cleavage/methylation domain-containing protein